MGKRFIITEDERSHIRSMYGLLTEAAVFTGCTFSKKSKRNLQDYDQIISKYGNDLNKVSQELTSIAKTLTDSVPELKQRSACQAALIKIRPSYKDKNFIIIDQLKNTAYFFDKSGKYLTGTWAITGRDKPNETWKDFAEMTYDERVEFLKKNGKSEAEAKTLAIKQPGASFTNPGIYSTGSWEPKAPPSEQNPYIEPTYAGSTDVNVFPLKSEKLGKVVTQAIHGTAPYAERKTAETKAQKIDLSKDLPKDINLNLSSGCINLPGTFIEQHRNELQNSYVFVITSEENDYYVFNPRPLVNTPEDCHSPSDLGVWSA